MTRRDEAKKQRRLKRLQKRHGRGASGASVDDSRDLSESANLFGFLKGLNRQLSLPEPARWPGGSDPSLARPDGVKFDFAE
jgi:hypothetical protein